MIVEAILKAAEAHGASRSESYPLRLSNAGTCARKIAYQLHRIPGEPLSARSVLVFQLGDITEAALREWAKKGSVEIGSPQLEVSMSVNGTGITGHLDGTILSEGAQHVIDFKSISTRGMDRVKMDGPPYEASCQVNAYMEAADLKTWALLVYYDKNTSHLYECTVEYDPVIVKQIRSRFKRVIDSTVDSLPERAHELVMEMVRRKPTGQWILPWQCSYCAWKRPCWGVKEPEYGVGGRPVWVVDRSSESGGRI